MAEDTIRVLGLSGSLRQGSYNSAALRAALELVPDGVQIATFERIGEFPLYDEDVKQRGFPPPVEAFREAIRAADALLIVTPEYNRSIPGVLKNAIDWASRPPDQPFDGKPVAIMGVSPGRLGTALAQNHLRQSLVALNGLVLNRPGVLIGGARQLFDDQGRLQDDATRDIIRQLLASLLDWARRHARHPAGT